MTLKLRHLAPAAVLAPTLVLAFACSRTPEAAPPSAPLAEAPLPAALPPVEPPAPGTPGGLPDDRTPISEAPFRPDSPQGAADVVQTYYAHLGEKAYGKAWALWADAGKASTHGTAAAFAKSFERYAQYDAQVGGPGVIEGAAGSSYITVPVVIYGRLKTGAEVHETGEATLRRVNDVPGATSEQRAWRIAKIETKPTP